jgi:leader peptidase (prepilin peptidase) / N-methyltransferase
LPVLQGSAIPTFVFLEFLMSSMTWYLLLTALVGLCIGSFLNVVIYRLPRMLERGWGREMADALEYQAESCADSAQRDVYRQARAALLTQQPDGTFNLCLPNSTCPSCKTPILHRDNLPLISWLFLKGRCRNCQTRISWRYPLVELMTSVLFVIGLLSFGAGVPAIMAMLLLAALICLTMIDFDTQLLPDNITLPMLWLGLLYNYFYPGFTHPTQALLGAVLGYGLLWSIYWIFKLLTGKEGMGYGDFKLLAMLGAWLGLAQLPLIILAASIVGLVGGLIAVRGQFGLKFAFGPYLALGGVISLLWGDTLLALYLGAAR